MIAVGITFQSSKILCDSAIYCCAAFNGLISLQKCACITQTTPKRLYFMLSPSLVATHPHHTVLFSWSDWRVEHIT